MSVALAEPSQAVDAVAAISQIAWNSPRTEASRINGRLSHGPVTPEGKERSRRNGCKEGLTGAGVVLPPAAAAEVARREAEFVRDLRPVNAIERELVRQLALAAWRAREISTRIIAHDARMCAARFARWEQDERIAAAALGRKLGDDPETVVALLQHGSAGCDWLIGRWELLLGGLLAADERASSQGTWSDADLTLALDLLGRPANLRHLDHRAAHLTLLREQARTGSAQAVEELREIIDEVEMSARN